MATHPEEDDEKLFIQQITEKETRQTVLVTGSFVEIDETDYRDHPSDIDLMICMTNINGVSIQNQKTTNFSRSFNGRRIEHTLHHPGCHPGFTKIEKPDHDYLQSLFSSGRIAVKGEGPAMKVGKMWEHPVLKFGLNNGLDIVFCVPCQGWPETASAWKTRYRASGWPSSHLVEIVVSGGYHLVDKPHPLHVGDDVFWRISFSKAECLLMHNLNQVQKRVYVLLRKIKTLLAQECRRGNDSVLSTYFFKTAMLWMCEEKPKEFWEIENIPRAIREILITVVAWLIERNSPNYFIPENNMLDHLADDFDLRREMKSLTRMIQSNWSEVEMRLTTKHEDHLTMHELTKRLNDLEAMRPFGVDLVLPFVDSAQPKRTMEVGNNIDDLLKSFKPKSFDDQILSKLYKVLCQWDLDKCLSFGESYVTVYSAPYICANRTKHGDIDLLKLIFSGSSSNVSEDVWKSISRSEAINLALTGVQGQTIGGISRPLFVVSAYLANYYWAVEKDYESAMLISETITNACSSELVYNLIGENSYPFLLSSRWSKLFDENVRTVHGFFVISNAFDPETEQFATVADSESTIKFCAVLFLHYIKVQLELKHGDKARIKSAVQSFILHAIHNCPKDGHNWTCADLPEEILWVMLSNSLAASDQLKVFDELTGIDSNQHQTSVETEITDEQHMNVASDPTNAENHHDTNVIDKFLKELSAADDL